MTLTNGNGSDPQFFLRVASFPSSRSSSCALRVSMDSGFAGPVDRRPLVVSAASRWRRPPSNRRSRQWPGTAAGAESRSARTEQLRLVSHCHGSGFRARHVKRLATLAEALGAGNPALRPRPAGPHGDSHGGSDRNPELRAARASRRRPWSRGSGRSRPRAPPARGRPRGRRRARAARSSALPPPPEAITGIGHGVGDRAHQLEVVARARPVLVHAGQQDLAGAGRRHAPRPRRPRRCPVGRRPPWVQTSQRAFRRRRAAGRRGLASIASTRLALPILTAASPPGPGSRPRPS